MSSCCCSSDSSRVSCEPNTGCYSKQRNANDPQSSLQRRCRLFVDMQSSLMCSCYMAARLHAFEVAVEFLFWPRLGGIERQSSWILSRGGTRRTLTRIHARSKASSRPSVRLCPKRPIRCITKWLDQSRMHMAATGCLTFDPSAGFFLCVWEPHERKHWGRYHPCTALPRARPAKQSPGLT